MRSISLTQDQLDRIVEQDEVLEVDGGLVGYESVGYDKGPWGPFSEEHVDSWMDGEIDFLIALRDVDLVAIEDGRDSIPFSGMGVHVVVE